MSPFSFLALDGEMGPLNAVATRSENGKTALKIVNPSQDAAQVQVKIKGIPRTLNATMKLVAPGALDARNTLQMPNVVHAMPGKVTTNGHTMTFEMPPLSAGVVSIHGE